MTEVWLQHSSECNLPHLICTWYLSSSKNIWRYFFRRFCFLKICQSFVSSLWYASACRPNTVTVTLWAFGVEYCLRCSDWLKLLGWLAAPNPLCLCWFGLELPPLCPDPKGGGLGVWLWCLVLVSGHGVWLWCLVMVSGCGLVMVSWCLVKVVLVSGCGVWSWCLSSCGVWSWCLGVRS